MSTAAMPPRTQEEAGLHRAGASSPTTLPRWAVVGYGLLTVLLGVALLAWPAATLLVAIWFLAAQLVVFAVVQLVRAFQAEASTTGERTFLVLGAALSLLAGILVLRKPLQSLLVVTLLVGAGWVVRGVLDLVTVLPGNAGNRGWSLLLGVISILAGGYVLLNPGISLLTFVWVSGIWMIVTGVVVAVAPFATARRAGA